MSKPQTRIVDTEMKDSLLIELVKKARQEFAYSRGLTYLDVCERESYNTVYPEIVLEVEDTNYSGENKDYIYIKQTKGTNLKDPMSLAITTMFKDRWEKTITHQGVKLKLKQVIIKEEK